MTGMSPWLGRLILLLALITIDHASPALAVTLVIGAAGAATAIFLYRGSYLPRFVMDILDRLSNKTSLQQAYEKRSQSLARSTPTIWRRASAATCSARYWPGNSAAKSRC